MNNTISDPHKYDALDVIRFILSFFVIAIHYPPFSDINIYLNYETTQCLCRIAVPFYFITSGFFIAQKAHICTSKYDLGVLIRYIKQNIIIYLIWTLIYSPWIIKDEIILSPYGPIKGLFLWLFHLVFSGSYWHLWYLNALIWSVVILIVFLRFKLRITVICIFSFVLYLIGLLGESYFGVIKHLENNNIIWSILKATKVFMGTTRNGLFFGLLFICLGALISVEKVKNHKPIINIIGLSASLLLLSIESFLLIKFDYARANDMYLFLIPSTYFLFSLTIQLNWNIGKYNRYLRSLYSCLYLIHPFIINLFLLVTSELGIVAINSFTGYCIITIISLIVSICVLRITTIIRRKV